MQIILLLVRTEDERKYVKNTVFSVCGDYVCF